jgi:hypothetical protein
VSTTKTYQRTLQDALNDANINELADILRNMKLGDMLSPVKVTVTGMTGAASYDITNPTTFAGATVTIAGLPNSGDAESPIFPSALVELPPILSVRTLRVTAATTAASAGTYVVSDAGGATVSPATHTIVGVALLSDDGKTLTFPSADVTAFILEYTPRSALDLQTAPFPPSSGS